jgi:hypothetical protein
LPKPAKEVYIEIAAVEAYKEGQLPAFQYGPLMI